MRKKKKCMKCGYWNDPEAPYCGLCYEPFNKKRPEGAGPTAPALPEPSRPPKPLPWLLKGSFLLLGMAFVAVLVPELPGVKPAKPAAASVNRYSAKTDEADNLLARLADDKEALLADIAAARPDPADFGLGGRWTDRLFKLEDDYAVAINALALPCRSCVDAERDAAYLEWADGFMRRENEASQKFSARYQELVRRALGAG